MRDEANDVVVEADLEAPPEKVWRAFSEPDLAAAWLAAGEMRTGPGERFSLEDEGRRIDCEVLEAEPARRLRLAWREADGALASEVSFILAPTEDGGTHLTIRHGPVVMSLAVARRRLASRPPPAMRPSTLSFRMAA